MCTDIPLIFHAMPESLRVRIVAKHLGPAPCWFVREAIVGHVPMHLGVTLAGIRSQAGRAQLTLRRPGGEDLMIEADHVIAATGYKAAVSKLAFIDGTLQSCIRKVAEAPVTNRHFESSVSGLYFVGAAAANSFGPLLRFAYGAKFAAKRVAAHVARA
jgi:thioredoxin reductase